ncbi:MAG: archaellin/type IV pilin N-terminal domain-containing protein [Candidatus Aenigmatarchaeota archaeon]
MKGISPLISSLLLIAITVSAIILVLHLGTPATERTKEILLLREGKTNLKSIDNYVKDVSQEGEGSTRSLTLSISDGEYYIDAENETLRFIMQTKYQIIGAGVSKIEDGVNITGKIGYVYLTIDYDEINITNGGQFGKGSYNLLIKNNGLDQTDKQIISIIV